MLQPGKLRILIRRKAAPQHFLLGVGPSLPVKEIIHVRPVCDETEGAVAVIIIGRLVPLKVIPFLSPKIYPVVRAQHGDHPGIVAMDRRTDLRHRVRLCPKLPAWDLIQLLGRLVPGNCLGRSARIQFLLRLCCRLFDRPRLRLLFLCIVVDIGGSPIHFRCIILGHFFRVKFQRLSVLFAPAFRTSKNGSAAADRPHTVYFFFSHPGPPYRSCCFAGFCFLSGSAGFVSFIRCRTEGLRSGSSAEVILTYSPIMFSASW